MKHFDQITIIFNPNSTGDAPRLARELKNQLAERLPGTPARLVETERAGHAETLARAAATASARPLVVSVSGDGGYHEVVNGVMASGSRQAVCAVRGAGNANDHRSATRQQPLVESIVAGEVETFDLLKVDVAGQPSRYAHSYMGLGISPVVAKELNRHSLNPVREAILVIQTFRAYRPFTIKAAGITQKLDSLVCANIPRMAKLLKLSDEQAPTDGRFELVAAKHASKWRLLATSLRLATLGAPTPVKLESYDFETVTALPMQLDGELVKLPAGAQVTVASAHGALRTLV